VLAYIIQEKAVVDTLRAERLDICRDENVIVPCSEQVKVDQNASELFSGKRLKNQVEYRIFITDQNTLGDLQNRGSDIALQVEHAPDSSPIRQAPWILRPRACESAISKQL
jgi:hypothetical protein